MVQIFNFSCCHRMTYINRRLDKNYDPACKTSVPGEPGRGKSQPLIYKRLFSHSGVCRRGIYSPLYGSAIFRAS